MNSFSNFLQYLEKEQIRKFQIKSLSICLSKKFKIPKSKITLFCRIMKEFNMIEQKHESGNCQSICASCYEYGCDAGPRPPITYWEVKTFNNEVAEMKSSK